MPVAVIVIPAADELYIVTLSPTAKPVLLLIVTPEDTFTCLPASAATIVVLELAGMLVIVEPVYPITVLALPVNPTLPLYPTAVLALPAYPWAPSVAVICQVVPS